jgi:predicted DsbA family dithiol-disulfide isomerase
MHGWARPAALAALAADDEGKFAALHERLFALKGALSDASMQAAEVASGLDPSRMDMERAAPRLARSQALAAQLGVHGTPTFFIDGRHVVGAQPFETFREVIDERLGAAKALVANGTPRRDVYAAMTSSGAARVTKDDDQCEGGCAAGGGGGS